MATASPSGVRLQVQAVERHFGKVAALAGVDLTVEPGELLTILGPSGSGKSTLLRIVAGYDLPDAGAVLLSGDDITVLPPAKRDIGMVFQNYALFPHMTVAENIAFPLQMRRMAKAEIRRKVDWALETVELAGYGERFPKQLSGGQQQRVALARAVVFDPRLLLLDEPFGALDRKLREQMQLEVKHLQKRLGLTTLFVTHDQEEALILSDRIVVMRDGLIEQVGGPRDIYGHPVSRFVAEFIGESNLLPGRVLGEEEGALAVEAEGLGRVLVRTRTADRPAAGGDVGLLLRPEALRLSSGGEGVEATVKEAIFVGQTQRVVATTAAGRDLLLRLPTAGGGGEATVGESVRVCWHPDDLHLVRWT